MNWYTSPLDNQGNPLRFNWSFAHLRKYVTECVQAMGGHTNRDYNFQLIKIPVKYWRGPIGYIRAKPISMVERGFNEQYANRDHYKLGVWMSRTLEERQGRLKGLVVPPQISPVWNPEARTHHSAQTSFSLLFVESGTRKLRKVVESRTKLLFDVKRFLDSTTVPVLDSTPILLL